jgi:hypothetical protein
VIQKSEEELLGIVHREKKKKIIPLETGKKAHRFRETEKNIHPSIHCKKEIVVCQISNRK